MLDSIEHEDQVRKHLIRLAVMKVRTSKPTNIGKTNPETEELVRKCHNFELTINKLKQEYTTKERLNESKMEKLKDDLLRLRKQLKDQTSKAPISRNSGGGGGLSSNITPYLAKTVGQKSFLSPTATSRQKSSLFSTSGVSAAGIRTGILSPIHPRERVVNKVVGPRGKYTTFKTFGQSQGLMKTPRSTLSSKLLVNQAEVNKVSDTPTRSPGKTPSRLSFVERFDADDSEKSPSPDFTPTKRVPALGSSSRPSSSQTIDDILTSSSFAKGADKDADKDDDNDKEEGPDANSTSIMTDYQADEAPTKSSHDSRDSDIFASANSSLNNTVIISQENVKKKKRLNLAGSLVGSRNASKSLNLEQEGINSVDYYKDDNIMDLSDNSPNKTNTTFEKKKRKVFSIN